MPTQNDQEMSPSPSQPGEAEKRSLGVSKQKQEEAVELPAHCGSDGA